MVVLCERTIVPALPYPAMSLSDTPRETMHGKDIAEKLLVAISEMEMTDENRSADANIGSTIKAIDNDCVMIDQDHASSELPTDAQQPPSESTYVDPRVAEYTAQLPVFVQSLHGIFVRLMESLRDSKLPAFPSEDLRTHLQAQPSLLDSPELLKQAVWYMIEGELLPLSEVVKKLRAELPSELADRLPLALTRVTDIIMSGAERKAYGLSWDCPKDLQAKLESPAYPALLVWEVETKTLTTSILASSALPPTPQSGQPAPDAFSATPDAQQQLAPSSTAPQHPVIFTPLIRKQMEETRRHRKELKQRLSAIEKLVKAVQQKEPIERIITAREKWREFEKKDELARQQRELIEKQKAVELQRRNEITARQELEAQKRTEEIKRRQDEQIKRQQERQSEIDKRNEEQARRIAERNLEIKKRNDEVAQKKLEKQIEAQRKSEEDLMKKADIQAKKMQKENLRKHRELSKESKKPETQIPNKQQSPKNTLFSFFKKPTAPADSLVPMVQGLPTPQPPQNTSPTSSEVQISIPGPGGDWLNYWKTLSGIFRRAKKLSAESFIGREGDSLAILPGWAAAENSDSAQTAETLKASSCITGYDFENPEISSYHQSDLDMEICSPNESRNELKAERIINGLSRKVFVSIHDRARPAIKILCGIALGRSYALRPGNPCELFEYDRDTDEEWDEQHNGEDLESDDEDDESDDGEMLPEEAGDSFVVADGYFGEGDDISEDEFDAAKKSHVDSAQTPELNGARNNILTSQPAHTGGRASGITPVFFCRSTYQDMEISSSSKYLDLMVTGALDAIVYNKATYFKHIAEQTEKPTKRKSLSDSNTQKIHTAFAKAQTTVFDICGPHQFESIGYGLESTSPEKDPKIPRDSLTPNLSATIVTPGKPLVKPLKQKTPSAYPSVATAFAISTPTPHSSQVVELPHDHLLSQDNNNFQIVEDEDLDA